VPRQSGQRRADLETKTGHLRVQFPRPRGGARIQDHRARRPPQGPHRYNWRAGARRPPREQPAHLRPTILPGKRVDGSRSSTWAVEASAQNHRVCAVSRGSVDPSEITQIGGSARVLLEPSQHSVWSHLV